MGFKSPQPLPGACAHPAAAHPPTHPPVPTRSITHTPHAFCAPQRYDRATGYVCGTMEARNVPEAEAPVTTFFEGEVVDNVNHTFYTGAALRAGGRRQ